MALATYVCRVFAFTVIRHPIENRFFQSFLYYVPYTVLAVMTVPAILSATDHFISALAGLVVGIIVAWFEKGLLTVALSACGAVLAVELIIRYLM